MHLFEKAIKTIKEETKNNPITKEQYQKEVNIHIEKCRGRPIFDAYKTFD